MGPSYITLYDDIDDGSYNMSYEYGSADDISVVVCIAISAYLATERAAESLKMARKDSAPITDSF